jgi:cytochrome c nitrite reductase small subunit
MKLFHAGMAASLALGAAVGLGAYTFVYARGGSYLTNDPAACANCHIMDEHYAAWTKSSHHAVAVCNDCHTPHGLIPKYATKASNGFWHSFAFTTGRFPDPLRIKPRNREITEHACRGCHELLTAAIDAAAHAPLSATGDTDDVEETDRISCIRCHANVGHWVR